MTAAQIIDAIIAQCGTDASRATVLSMLNEQYVSQVADARWMRILAAVAPTTAGQTQYAVPTNIIEAYGLLVGGIPYEPIGMDALWDVRAGFVSLSYGHGGVFAQTYDTAGLLVVDLQPAPEVNGVPIQLSAAVAPSLLTDSSVVPLTPLDTHPSLIDGTIALIYDRIDERPDMAAAPRVRFDAVTEKLRRRRNALLRGSGPLQVGIKGKTF